MIFAILAMVPISLRAALAPPSQVAAASFCVWLFADCAYHDILDVAHGQVRNNNAEIIQKGSQNRVVLNPLDYNAIIHVYIIISTLLYTL